jgi:hypothetical protein
VPNVLFYYVAIFLFGASGPLKNMIAYTHLMEFMGTKISEVSGVIFFLDDFVSVLSPLALMYLTKNTNSLLWFGLGQNLFGLFAFGLMYIPESTKYLLEKERFIEAKSDINYLLKFNKASESIKQECLSLLERYIEKQHSLNQK